MNKKWDFRFMNRAKQISYWSKDPEHRVGAIIVDEYNHQVSEGYNGPPRLVEDTQLERDKEVMRTLHAELNAVLLSSGFLKGASMYVYPFSPCAQCAAAIIQKGIKTVISFGQQEHLSNWAVSQNEALKMFKEAGVHHIFFQQIYKKS